MKINNIKSVNITTKYLSNKEFSYRLLVNILLEFNYNMDNEEWFYYDISNVHLGKISKLNEKTVAKKLNFSIYRLKVDEEGSKHLYINNPKKYFSVVNRNSLMKIRYSDEMLVRFYVLLAGWKYSKMEKVTQSKILEMIGYSPNSTPNKNKLTKCVNELARMNLIELQQGNLGKKKYNIYKLKQ